MKNLKFESPGTLLEVYTLLKGNEGKFCLIAGGTDLIIEMRQKRLKPETETLINIGLLNELNYIREDNEFIFIGAGTTHSVLSENTLIRQYVSFLADAAKTIGSPQTRNRGTIGGNILTAAQCADTIPPLLVLNADLKLISTNGERSVPIEEFFVSPKKTEIKPDEILVEIKIRKPDPSGRAVFKKLIRRKAVAKARINFSAFALQDSAGLIKDIRIAPGSVTPVHMRFHEAEDILRGKIPDLVLVKKTAEKVSEVMVGVTGRRWSTPFKEPVLKVMSERGLLEILEVENNGK